MQCQANPATKLFALVNIGKQRTRGAVMPQASSARVVEILEIIRDIEISRANLRYELGWSIGFTRVLFLRRP